MLLRSSAALFISLLSAGLLRAGNIATVSNIQYTGTPSPGASLNVSWDYTTADSFNDPRYVIIIGPTCAAQPANTANQYIVSGDGCVPGSQVNGNGCGTIPDNQTGPSITHSYNQTVSLPAGLTPGSTYYVIVGMKSYNIYMNPTVSFDAQACTSFTVPLPPPSITLTKAAEGNSALPGGKVLFTIYYSAANTANVTITDVVDSRFTINQVYNGGSAAGQTITWSLPGPFGAPQSGFVSFLATVQAGTPNNTVIPNQATAEGNSVSTVSSNVENVVVGTVGLDLIKSVAPLSAVSAGDTLTYTLIYATQGQSLAEFQNFDAGLPAGWNVHNGGTWVDSGGVLQQTQGPGVGYPGYMDGNVFIHDAVYVADLQVSSAATGNFDAVMRINADSATSPTLFWNIRISSDTNDVNIDRLGTNLASTSNPLGVPILNDTWYTVKAEVVCGNVRAKVWPRGSPEPGAYQVSTTDASLASAGNGYPGFQANNGPGLFDNLKVFSLSAATGVKVWDTVPPGTTYLAGSCTGGCTNNGGVLSWSPSIPCGNQGSVTFRATVNAGVCGPIDNQAMIDSSDPPPPNTSNSVSSVVNGGCPSPTATVTPTASATASPSRTATPSATSTATPSRSATPSASPSVTPSESPTATPTFTPSSTLTPTRSASPTATPSPTATGTISPGPSPTFTPTSTASPTASPSSSVTGTSSPTGSPTHTNSVTATQTLSASPTVSPSPSGTPTVTPSITITTPYSPTITPSITATATETVSFSPTPSLSDSPTPSLTATQTLSYSPSSSVTGTSSPTGSPTLTNSYTATQTPSATPSATETLTPTPSVTVSGTFTVSPTITPTPLPMPHHVVLAIYNSAGELVKRLFDGSAQFLPGDLSLDRDVVAGGAGGVNISVPGYLYDPVLGQLSSLLWLADNNAGQRVGSGVYTLKAEIEDQFGIVTALQKPIQVVDVVPRNEILIFNSAGEVVARPALPASPSGRPYTDLSLAPGQESFAPDYGANGLAANPLQFTLTDESGAQVPVTWDGRNAQGLPVASGSYSIQLIYSPSGGSSAVVESRSLTVLQAKSPSSLAGALAGPNPALRGEDILVSYPVGPDQAFARLYALDGELVGQGDDPSNGGLIRISSRGAASGLYFLVLEKRLGGAVLTRQVLKIAIVR